MLGEADVAAIMALYHSYFETGTHVSDYGAYVSAEKFAGAHIK